MENIKSHCKNCKHLLIDCNGHTIDEVWTACIYYQPKQDKPLNSSIVISKETLKKANELKEDMA